MSSVAVALVSLALLLTGVGWLLFKVIAQLRQSASRYRWFELFVCLFLIAWGFLMLLGLPRDAWSPWWAWFAGGSILSGSASLGILLREQFARPGVLRCSFCNKSQGNVKKLIAGPKVHICDECVAICLTILAEDKAGERVPEEPVPENTE